MVSRWALSCRHFLGSLQREFGFSALPIVFAWRAFSNSGSTSSRSFSNSFHSASSCGDQRFRRMPFGEMHRIRLFARNKIPRLVRRESKNRREHAGQPGDQLVNSRLRRAATRGIGGVGVETSFTTS